MSFDGVPKRMNGWRQKIASLSSEPAGRPTADGASLPMVATGASPFHFRLSGHDRSEGETGFSLHDILIVPGRRGKARNALWPKQKLLKRSRKPGFVPLHEGALASLDKPFFLV